MLKETQHNIKFYSEKFIMEIKIHKWYFSFKIDVFETIT